MDFTQTSIATTLPVMEAFYTIQGEDFTRDGQLISFALAVATLVVSGAMLKKAGMQINIQKYLQIKSYSKPAFNRED
jgi:hypothetical protein